MASKYDYSKSVSQYEELKNERAEWEAEWREISRFLLPGRGIYQTYSKPQKRKLTNRAVVNPIAEDSLYVLTSGMHSRLTSPAMPWFRCEWANTDLNDVYPLVEWLQECGKRLHTGLHRSNFYSVINSFYIEYAGFGTACTYMGEDSDTTDAPFRFELLTAGEYAFAVGADGLPNVFYRSIFMTAAQLVERFPKTAPKELKDRVAKNDSTIHRKYLTVLECVYKMPYQDKPYTRVFYEITSVGTRTASPHTHNKEPLEVSGFYEFPYNVARWNTIGSDTLGIGPGSRAIPQIKRLQEIEKATLMAAHKTINPPLNAPARMKGKLNTLPGGYNYYFNPGEQVSSLYNLNFDYNGISGVIERVEQRIKDIFFNDIFLTGARDPNASPYKATEVIARDREGMSRLGPVVERLQHEYLTPMIERGFNIMLRKGLFPELPSEYAELVGDYNISLISPMATAQRSASLEGINSYMAWLGQAAQFKPEVLDKIDVDGAADMIANVNGVDKSIHRSDDEVMDIRNKRAQAEAEEKQKQEGLATAGAASQMGAEGATTRKTSAEAGQILAETQDTMAQTGTL